MSMFCLKNDLYRFLFSSFFLLQELNQRFIYIRGSVPLFAKLT